MNRPPVHFRAHRSLGVDFFLLTKPSITDPPARRPHPPVQGREAPAFNVMVLSCMTEIRHSRPRDLTFTDFDFGITFWRARENEDGSLRLAFMEDSCVQFAFLPDTVPSHVGYHSMTLNRVDGPAIWTARTPG